MQLTPELPLAQPPQKLLARRGIDAFRFGPCIELGEQRDPVGLERRAVENVLADTPVERIVEMFGRQLAEQRS